MVEEPAKTFKKIWFQKKLNCLINQDKKKEGRALGLRVHDEHFLQASEQIT
jgi:hypothetical protein